MNKGNLIKIKVESIKRNLISTYRYVYIFILGTYSLLFYFLAKNILLAGYVFFGLCLTLYTFLVIRKDYHIERKVHAFLISATLFNFFIMVVFLKQSIASYIWFFPILIAAHIFFSKRVVVYYTIYITITIILAYIISENYTFSYPTFQNRRQLIFSDTLLFIFNLFSVFLLLYYKDKINKAEATSYFTNEETDDLIQENIEEPSEEELARYNDLFEKIEKIIKEEGHFTQSDFNLSKLSALLNTNNVYVSKAIKQNGYPNFITYLNTCRVNNFKQLISENDLRKVTLMYLYTASGFSNQSTFNRVFKQIEEITPSEYIQTQKEQESEN